MLTGLAALPPLGNSFLSMAVIGRLRIKAIAPPITKGNKMPHRKPK